MRPKYWFYHWAGGYKQALDLAENLDSRIILRKNSRYQHQPQDVVINWGSSKAPEVLNGVKVLNAFGKVGHGKRRNWQALQEAGVKIPFWTNKRSEAEKWKGRVMARKEDHGMGGSGIDVYENGAELAKSPKKYLFFVKYLKKELEFRFHIFLGKCIFIQEKLKKKGADNADKYIRSHGRGWCFAFKHFAKKPVPDRGTEVAANAVAALGLDFGAVDMAWSEQSGFTVLEVNSAPGIENTSLQAYVEAIRELR